MSRERFLLWMLAGVFTFQAGTFGFGVYNCARNGGLETCPDITQTYQQTFNVMIATTLALLTGNSMKGD